MKSKKHYLEAVEWGPLPITNYRGCYVTKLPSGRFAIWGHVELTAEGVDRLIDESLMSVSKSIKQ